MLRVAVLSDVHGNAVALEASGDPATAQVIEILRTPPTRGEVIEHAERLVSSN